MVNDGKREVELHECSMKRYRPRERTPESRALTKKPPRYLSGIDHYLATALSMSWGPAIGDQCVRLALVPVPLKPSPFKRLM